MGGLLGGGAPVVAPVAVAPTVDDAQMRIDRQRERQRRMARAATEVVQNESPVATAARALTGN